MRTLDLLSWNVHAPPFATRRDERLAAVAAEIERRAPEVVLLQEVWFPAAAVALGRRLAARYETFDGAARARPLRVGGLLALVRRDGGWRGDAAAVRFVRYVACASRWRIWEGDGLAGKGVQVLPLTHCASGQALVLLNTHVQAQYDTVRHRRSRAGQLRELADLAARLDAAVPVLAAGDFNTGPDEPQYADVMMPTWSDLTAPLRATRPTAATQFDCGAEPQWIDYVLARRSPYWQVDADLELIENTARDEPFSDHHGLHARVALSPSSANG